MNGLAYQIIYADPPWLYRDEMKAGERGAAFKYPTMSLEEIEHLPAVSLAAEDAALLLWATSPLLQEAMSVVEAWGFTCRTVAFVWGKLNPRAGTTFMGTGNYTRANAEICLLGTKGRMSRLIYGVSRLVRTPR